MTFTAPWRQDWGHENKHGEMVMAMMSQARHGPSGTRWRVLGWGSLAALLALPLIAMQFTSEVVWTLSDFLFMGLLFATVGGLFELAVRLSRSWAYRAGFGLTLLGCFLLVWINLAVGIFGSEDNPANLVFLAVIGTCLVGGLVSRGQAEGMARTLALAAAVQALIGAIGWSAGLGAPEPPGTLGILVLNGFFLILWLVASALFRRAAEEAAQSSSSS
jgi:hypothetical protein